MSNLLILKLVLREPISAAGCAPVVGSLAVGKVLHKFEPEERGLTLVPSLHLPASGEGRVASSVLARLTCDAH